MIFAVVAAIVTVVLLVAVVAFPAASQYRVAFLTIDIGLLAIIIYAIVKINKRSSKTDQLLQNAGNSKMTVDTCPDFFTAHYNAQGNTICKPEYKTPRSNYKYTFLNSEHDKLGNIELKNFNDQRASDVCSYVNAQDYQGVDQKAVPWTELRAKCASIRTYL